MTDAVPAAEAAATVPPIDRIEASIVTDLAKKALVAGPVLAVALGLWRGPSAALAVVLAVAVVVANLFASAEILGLTARRAPHLLTGVVLMSFLGRLIVITAVGVGIKALGITDWPVFCITLIGAYFLLLVWELRSISMSLAYPGLKPKPGNS